MDNWGSGKARKGRCYPNRICIWTARIAFLLRRYFPRVRTATSVFSSFPFRSALCIVHFSIPHSHTVFLPFIGVLNARSAPVSNPPSVAEYAGQSAATIYPCPSRQPTWLVKQPMNQASQLVLARLGGSLVLPPIW